MRLIADAFLEKLRGGFFTPKFIAQIYFAWGLSGQRVDTPEPGSGRKRNTISSQYLEKLSFPTFK